MVNGDRDAYLRLVVADVVIDAQTGRSTTIYKYASLHLVHELKNNDWIGESILPSVEKATIARIGKKSARMRQDARVAVGDLCVNQSG
jgi:hypothetical protein